MVQESKNVHASEYSETSHVIHLSEESSMKCVDPLLGRFDSFHTNLSVFEQICSTVHIFICFVPFIVSVLSVRFYHVLICSLHKITINTRMH